MNIMTCILEWNKHKNSKKSTKNTFSNEFLNLNVDRIHCFKSHGKNYFHNLENGNVCVILGYISNINEIKSKYNIKSKNDVEIIEKLYGIKELDFINELDGSFTVFIWNEKEKKGYIFLDHTGSILPIYYFSDKKKIVFSTSMKKMLENISCKREINIPVVHDFLFYKFPCSPTKGTLIKNVNKLLQNQFLELNYQKKEIKIRRYKKKIEKVSIDIAKKRFIKSMQLNTEELCKEINKKNIGCFVSSGYDSNLVLHYLSSVKGKNITTLTIGGKKVNETIKSKLISKYYKNIKHEIKLLDSNLLDDSPNVMWKTEGEVHNPFFLMNYEGVKAMEKNTNIIFSGTTIEPWVNITNYLEFVYPLKSLFMEFQYFIDILFGKKPSKKLRGFRFLLLRKCFGNLLFRLYTQPGHKGRISSKKIGSLLNNMGIQSIIPLLSEETKKYSMPLRKLNIKRAFYEKEVRKTIGDSKKHLEEDKITSKVKKPLIDIEFMFKNKEKEIMNLLKSEFAKDLLSKKLINKIIKKPQNNLFFIFRLLDLYLFNEIFVKEKFDSEFNKKDFNKKLEYFLG